ncbi:MAG: hypothetical protein R2877_04365 [Bdellovibrionota bacterium]
MWLLLALSMVAFWQYLLHRETVFQIPSPEYHLSEQPGREEIQKIVFPLLDFSSSSVEYSIDTFVDRSAVKFLQQTLSQDQFAAILSNENIPLWGWEILLKKPIQAKILISQQRRLIGLDIQSGPSLLKPLSDSFKSWAILQSKTGKDLSKYQNGVPYQASEIKFRRQIPETKLLESISVQFDRGTIRGFHSTILLPSTYASEINQTIEKQKTLHQVFNVFHYLLIGLIFLFMFRAYESKSLSWKKNIYVFLVLFFAQWISFFFKTNFEESWMFSIFQSLIQTIGHTTWMLVLIVSADFIARVYPKSKYTLSDIFSRSFFASRYFRQALISGWVLFVAQIVLVGMFYKIFQLYSAYVPLKIPGEHSLHHSFEFLKYFSESLSTATYEEILYRMFLICFLHSCSNVPGPPSVLSSILWDFCTFLTNLSLIISAVWN